MAVAILAHDGDVTADYLLLRARERAIPVDRIRLDRLEEADLSCTVSAHLKPDSGNLSIAGQIYDSVWCRSAYLVNRTSVERFSPDEFSSLQWSLALEAMEEIGLGPLFWMNRPSKVRLASNKLYQLELAKRFGLRTPATILSNDQAAIESFAARHERTVMKALQSGAVTLEDGSRRVVLTTVLDPSSMSADKDFSEFPALFQELIHGDDVRACVIGSQIFAFCCELGYETGALRDWRALERATWSPVSLPDEAASKLLELTAELELAYAAIDLVLDHSRSDYVLLEVNPSGQWAFLEDGDYVVTDAILNLLNRKTSGTS